MDDVVRIIREVRAILALLVVILTAVGIVDAVDKDGTTVVTPTRTVEAPPAAPPATAVDGPDADTQRDDAIVLDAEAQELLEEKTDGKGPAAELEGGGLRGDDGTEAGVLEGPLATPSMPGCRTAFVRNFSSRAGVKPSVIVWHQTVSRENGQSSQNALTAMANSPSSGVSWAFLIGRSNGLCTYTVPTAYKAWTQGNANLFSIGIEVEAYGDEATYVTGAGKAKLLAVTRELGRRYGIPMQRAIVRDCRVIRPGIAEHKDLDQATTCAGGHADVNLPGTDALIRELAQAAKPKPRSYLTAGERRHVRALEAARRAVTKAGGWKRAPAAARARARRARLAVEHHRDGLRRAIRSSGHKHHRGARLGVIVRVLGPRHR